MNYSSMTVSALLVLGVCTLLLISGITMRPGIGIVGAVLLIPLVMWIRGNGPADIGIQFPQSWRWTILQAFGWGVLISIVSLVLIAPLSEMLTGSAHDYGPVEKIKGNGRVLLQTLLFVWLFVAIAEEIIFRGFLVAEISKLLGNGFVAMTFNIIFTSVVFGFCHAYQNTSGIVTTGLIGALLGIVYVISGKNLWVAILTHGIIDTIGIFVIYFGADKFLHQLLWKPSEY